MKGKNLKSVPNQRKGESENVDFIIQGREIGLVGKVWSATLKEEVNYKRAKHVIRAHLP